MKATIFGMHWFGRIILLVVIFLVMPGVGGAKVVVWQGAIPSNGHEVGPVKLVQGETYSIRVGGNFYMGQWWRNQQPMVNDPCYEFVAHGQPAPISVLRNTLGLNWCSRYDPRHEYESKPFNSDGSALKFKIFDSNYTDNRGDLQAVVYRHRSTQQKEIPGDVRGNSPTVQNTELRGAAASQETQNRWSAAKRFKDAVEQYYKKYKRYPNSQTSAQDFVIDDQIRNYLDTGDIRYSVDRTGKEWFIVQSIDAGGLRWSGRQYTNKPEMLNLPESVELKGPGWYMLDLH